MSHPIHSRTQSGWRQFMYEHGPTKRSQALLAVPMEDAQARLQRLDGSGFAKREGVGIFARDISYRVRVDGNRAVVEGPFNAGRRIRLVTEVQLWPHPQGTVMQLRSQPEPTQIVISLMALLIWSILGFALLRDFFFVALIFWIGPIMAIGMWVTFTSEAARLRRELLKALGFDPASETRRLSGESQ